MLDVYLEEGEKDDHTTFSMIVIITISAENKITCDICDQEAFIFQEEGNFCLSCWQNRTEPNITQQRI
jgi:hypothetical protein